MCGCGAGRRRSLINKSGGDQDKLYIYRTSTSEIFCFGEYIRKKRKWLDFVLNGTVRYNMKPHHESSMNGIFNGHTISNKDPLFSGYSKGFR